MNRGDLLVFGLCLVIALALALFFFLAWFAPESVSFIRFNEVPR